MICWRRVIRLNLGIKKYKKKIRFIIQILQFFSFIQIHIFLPLAQCDWVPSVTTGDLDVRRLYRCVQTQEPSHFLPGTIFPS